MIPVQTLRSSSSHTAMETGTHDADIEILFYSRCRQYGSLIFSIYLYSFLLFIFLFFYLTFPSAEVTSHGGLPGVCYMHDV